MTVQSLEVAEAADKAATRDVAAIFRPLKIALLGYRSKPHCGGQGVYIHYLSKALVNMGHRVDVISGEPYPVLDERVRLIKMPGMNLFEKDPIRSFRLHNLKSATDLIEYAGVLSGGFPEPWTFTRRVVSFLKAHDTDYDLIHDNQSLGFGLLEIQKMGIPVIATIHHPIHKDLEIALGTAKSRADRAAMKRWHSFLLMQNHVVKRLRHLVTVSECSRQDIASAFGISAEHVDLIYNGIDTEVYKPLPNVTRKPFRLMTTASADVPLKGLDVLIKAIARLLPKYPELELLVIGSPKKGGRTAKLIRRLGVGDSVSFVSGIEDQEIVQFYAEATLAVSPSIYEGFGLPAGEAMSCGVPIITSDGGALPEVVGDAGILVKAGDDEALSLAIEQLLNDKDQRKCLGAAGRKRIIESFSWKVAAKQMTDYYNEVIKLESSDP